MAIIAPKVSFFTPGRRLPHQESYIIVDQCYVQYKRASSYTADLKPWPILFIHGGGLTGAQWESTPDRRPGWACLANDLGYDAYLMDTVDNGRSQRAPAYIRPDGSIEHRTAAEILSRFRIDSVGSTTLADSSFPLEHLDSLVGAQVSRYRTNDAAEAEGIIDVIESLGDCIVVAHSHGCKILIDTFGTSRGGRVARRNLKQIVLVEPAVYSKDPRDSFLYEVPTLVVWGANTDTHPAWRDLSSPWLDSGLKNILLPEIGLSGNSHFPMSDSNSDLVFGTIADWLLATFKPKSTIAHV